MGEERQLDPGPEGRGKDDRSPKASLPWVRPGEEGQTRPSSTGGLYFLEGVIGGGVGLVSGQGD